MQRSPVEAAHTQEVRVVSKEAPYASDWGGTACTKKARTRRARTNALADRQSSRCLTEQKRLREATTGTVVWTRFEQKNRRTKEGPQRERGG